MRFKVKLEDEKATLDSRPAGMLPDKKLSGSAINPSAGDALNRLFGSVPMILQALNENLTRVEGSQDVAGSWRLYKLVLKKIKFCRAPNGEMA